MEIYTLNDDSGKHGANCSLHEVKMKDLRLMKTLLVSDGLHEMPVLQSTELEYVSKILFSYTIHHKHIWQKFIV